MFSKNNAIYLHNFYFCVGMRRFPVMRKAHVLASYF